MKVKSESVKSLNHVQLFVIPWTVARQAPLSMGFSRHARVGSHALLQGIFPTRGSNPHLMSPALAGGFFTTSAIWEGKKTHMIPFNMINIH